MSVHPSGFVRQITGDFVCHRGILGTLHHRRQRLLNEFNTEIGGGLGTLKGQIWRIGLMGHSSTEENVVLLLSCLEKLMASEGYQAPPGEGVAAALKTLRA